jgi:hypothetical protein
VPLGFVYKGGNSNYKFYYYYYYYYYIFFPHFWRQKNLSNHCLKKKKLFLAKLRQLKEKPAGQQQNTLLRTVSV